MNFNQSVGQLITYYISMLYYGSRQAYHAVNDAYDLWDMVFSIRKLSIRETRIAHRCTEDNNNVPKTNNECSF